MNSENKNLLVVFFAITEIFISVPLIVAFRHLITTNEPLYYLFVFSLGILFGIGHSIIKKYFYE